MDQCGPKLKALKSLRLDISATYFRNQISNSRYETYWWNCRNDLTIMCSFDRWRIIIDCSCELRRMWHVSLYHSDRKNT